MNLKSSEILTSAQTTLLEHGWCKGTPRNTSGQHCIVGAVDPEMIMSDLLQLRMGPRPRAEIYLYGALRDRCWSGRALTLPEYNDLPSTTFNDVYSLFDDAILLAKEAGD